MTGPAIACAFRTDRGRVRPHNEDAVSIWPEQGVIVVADGIGGANAGEVASAMAIQVIGQRLRRQEPARDDPNRALRWVAAAVQEAGGAICEMATRRPDCAGMGTTVVIGLIGEAWMACGHVGDSRLYRLRGGALTRLTTDHSLIQDVVSRGLFPSIEQARASGIGANLLTRAVGSSNQVVVDTRIVELEPGDLYLFCTDGLTGMLPDPELARLLALGAGDLESLADELVCEALDAGGIDNITLALVRVDGLDVA